MIPSKILIAGDLHLTGNPKDAYRWDLFPWMIKVCKKKGIHDIFIIGDISDFKDNHPSAYVNLLCDAIASLAEEGLTVHILKGNHDYLQDPKMPFFKFLRHFKNVKFYTDPAFLPAQNILMLPHTRTPDSDWKELKLLEDTIVFCHQPVIGAKSSDLYEIEHGLDAKFFTKNFPEFQGPVISGDIHLPQVVGDFEYIGAPYPIRFNDGVDGQVLVLDLDSLEPEYIPFDTIKKSKIVVQSISALKDQIKDLQPGDQVKVSFNASPADAVAWEQIKKEVSSLCDGAKVELSEVKLDVQQLAIDTDISLEDLSKSLKGSNDQEVLKSFCERENIDASFYKVGQKFLEA